MVLAKVFNLSFWWFLKYEISYVNILPCQEFMFPWNILPDMERNTISYIKTGYSVSIPAFQQDILKHSLSRILGCGRMPTQPILKKRNGTVVYIPQNLKPYPIHHIFLSFLHFRSRYL